MKKAIDFISAVARKILSMRGKGIASIANRSDAEAKAGEIAAIFQQSGLPMNRLDEFIKSEKDVTKYLNLIEESAKSKVKQSIQPKPLMKSSKPGDVIDFPPERITDWTKARPQPPEIEMIDGIQTTRGMGDLFSKQMKNIGKKKDPALYEDRGGNIIPAQFEIHPTSEIAKSLRLEAEAAKKLKNMSEAEIKLRGNRPYDTDEQIIARIKKQNKEAAERLRNKKNKDPDEPEGFYQGGQAQIEPDLSNIGHGSDALMARNRLLTPGSQATTSTGLSYLLGEDNDTTRVPYKEKGSVTLADLIKVNASGNKSGKNQIMGAPDGITANTETFNAIIKMDIPIMEKINLLGSYGYGKDRFKVEKDNKELFLGEDGYKDRNIGLGFNQNGEGLSGSVIRNLETGDNDYQLKFLKSFAEGGRAGYNEGNMVVPKPKPMDEYLLKQVISPAGIRTLAPETRQMLIEELKEKIRNKRAAEEKKYQFEELRDQGAEDLYYDKREKELDIKYNPQNYPPSMRKFAGGGVAGLLGEGPRSMVQEPRTNYKEAGVVDKIGGMVNYKNVPYYVNSAAKGATNIAEWMGRLPFAATELASDMIKKPLFKAGDEIPGLPGVGAKFVGGEMFKKFGDNLETGALAEKLGLSSLVEEGGKNLTPEARTVGGLLELGGEFANIGGILAAGKNLFKGGDSLKKLSQSMGKVKDNKTLEKLVDETLTARGEGRRDFNKLVASGGLMVALQSIGLGGIKAAKTKSAPDAVLTLKTLIDDSDVMTDSGPIAVGRPGSLIDVSGLTDAVKKSLAVIMKNRKNTFGDKVVRNKVKGKGGKFTDDYEDISTEDAAYIMEELQKRGHNVKLEHYDDMGGQGVDDLLDKFKNKDGIYGKDNYDKFSKKVAKMTDKEKLAYHTSITDDSGNYYDEFVEELLDMNFKNNPK
jgi:hypothetical protein